MADADAQFSLAAMHVEYDESARELGVLFRDGRSFVYSAVPPSVYRDLMNAQSRAAYYLDRVRDAYPCVQARSQRRA